jgi:hypothetical protein
VQAFISYVKMVHVCRNRDVFQPDQLPLPEFAASLGLPGSPVVVLAPTRVRIRPYGSLTVV